MAEVDDKSSSNKAIFKRKNRRNFKTSSHSGYVFRKTKFFRSNKRGSTDIFVNNQTHFKGHLYKCEKLLDNGASELIIHGLGAAIHKAINLALQLKRAHHDCLELDVKTSTVILEDQLESLSDDLDDEISNRRNSAIHIRVFRKVPLAVLRTADECVSTN